MTTAERAKELAEAHWGYVGQLIQTHGAGGELMQIVGFHYRSAFAHGHKHGIEDVGRPSVHSKEFKARFDGELPTAFGPFIPHAEDTAPLPGTPRYKEIHTPLTAGEVAVTVAEHKCVDDGGMFFGTCKVCGADLG